MKMSMIPAFRMEQIQTMEKDCPHCGQTNRLVETDDFDTTYVEQLCFNCGEELRGQRNS